MSNQILALTASAITINHLAALLEENDIPYLIKDHTESARLAGFGSLQNDVDLYVQEEDQEKVQMLIKDLPGV